MARAEELPDAPSAVLGYSVAGAAVETQQSPQLPPLIAAPDQPVTKNIPSCDNVRQSAWRGVPWVQPGSQYPAGTHCLGETSLQPIVTGNASRPLTPELKGFLAIRDVTDPFNLLTIAAYSGIVIAANSHSAYGPGYAGWGRLSGYSLLEDMQSEFFGTFAIPSLVHEDPRYHRLPGKPVKQRILHALVHTVVTQHDDGTRMINYATLLTYPIDAELSNLYVPGLSTNASSTAKRIVAGYATDPVGPLLAEFLPDIAKHIHVRVVFVQQILQQIASGNSNTATLF